MLLSVFKRVFFSIELYSYHWKLDDTCIFGQWLPESWTPRPKSRAAISMEKARTRLFYSHTCTKSTFGRKNRALIGRDLFRTAIRLAERRITPYHTIYSLAAALVHAMLGEWGSASCTRLKYSTEKNAQNWDHNKSQEPIIYEETLKAINVNW